jgi:site-specific DNA recombinase
MNTDTYRKVLAGDLTGLNILGIARLSDESKFRASERKRRRRKGPKGYPGGKRRRPMTGLEINNRDEQELDMRQATKAGRGRYLRTLHEAHTSAWKRRRMQDANGQVVFRVVRPTLDEALRILRAGVDIDGARVDAVMVPNLDRLTRDPRTLEDVIDVVMHCGRPIIDPYGTLDLMTDQGRANARAIVGHKHSQSADAARRVRRKASAMQREGIPAGGTRPFGWRKDKRRLHPVESGILLTAIEEVLEGRTRYAVVKQWREEGVTTVRGNVWRKETLTAVLRNPRLCGYRAISVQDSDATEGTRSRHMVILYTTKRVRDRLTGKKVRRKVPVIGQWEPLITPEKFFALLAIIGDKPGRGPGDNSRKYQGTGILRCTKNGCDTPLRGQKTHESDGKPEGHYTYVCRSSGSGGCGGLRIDGAQTDAYLRELVIAKYQEQATKQAAIIPQEWDGQPKLDRVIEDMHALRAARDKGLISVQRYYQDLSEYEAEMATLRQEQARVVRLTEARMPLPVDLPQIWDGLDLAERRAILERLFSAVLVAPAGRGQRTPVIDRLTPVPRYGLAA